MTEEVNEMGEKALHVVSVVRKGFLKLVSDQIVRT